MNYAEHFSLLLSHVRLWVRTTSFAEYVPTELQCAAGYRTDGTDTRVADAICDLWQRGTLFDVVTSKRELGTLAGVSPNSALKALRRLHGWFTHVDVLTTDGTETGAYRLRLGEVVSRTLTTYNTELLQGGQSTPNETANEYSARKADDPWLSGTSPTVRKWAHRNAADEGLTAKEWLGRYTQAGLGETALRLVDALTRCADMTAQELADETGKTLGAVRRAVRRLEVLGLCESQRETLRSPKTYGLSDDWQLKLDELAPTLRTWQLGDWREARRLEEALYWHVRRMEKLLDEDALKAARRRKAALETRRFEVLARLHPQLDTSEVWAMAKEVDVKRRTQAMAAIAERTFAPRLLAAWKSTEGLPKEQRESMMETAGWNMHDVSKAVRLLAYAEVQR